MEAMFTLQDKPYFLPNASSSTITTIITLSSTFWVTELFVENEIIQV